VTPQIDKIVATYIDLRDKKSQITAGHKVELAPINTALDQAEAFLLKAMQESGATAFSTAAGTAYQSVKTSATVADWPGLLEFIKERGLWVMLERRVAKTAVDEYVAEHKDLPPGINYHREITVNVRRA